MKKTPDYEVSSGNVFKDLGLPNAEELLAKAELVRQISVIVDERGLTQTEAAELLGTTQPKLSELLRGRLSGFSMERILRFLKRLDRDIEIVVRPKARRRKEAHLSVTAA
jgi:predicted XRE-type DNA-binding protein